MEVIIDKRGDTPSIEAKKLTIKLNDDVDYEISVNKFGELVIQKQSYGGEESSIVLKPSVSNEIRLT